MQQAKAWQSQGRAAALRSVEERDVARRNIDHVDVQLFQHAQDSLHFAPAAFELIAFLRFPYRPNFLGELWRRVKIGSREIQNERARDDTHFDDQQFIVETD